MNWPSAPEGKLPVFFKAVCSTDILEKIVWNKICHKVHNYVTYPGELSPNTYKYIGCVYVKIYMLFNSSPNSIKTAHNSCFRCKETISAKNFA